MKTISGKISEAPEAVTLIDAHHHLWDLSMARHPWLGDHPETGFFLGDYSALKRNYLPADYLKDACAHNVLATVHCEAEWDRDDQVGETKWISAIQARYGFPNAVVAHAWFHTPPTFWRSRRRFRWFAAYAPNPSPLPILARN
jgi:predicted TIM-barrel fold metal-dependent hydrolase